MFGLRKALNPVAVELVHETVARDLAMLRYGSISICCGVRWFVTFPPVGNEKLPRHFEISEERSMIRSASFLITALVLSTATLSAKADPMDQRSGPMGMERMQHWAADHEVLLDAKLAGLKAGLKLTPDQEKLWEPFEAAVRDAAKMRMEHMRAMMAHMRGMMGDYVERRSPVDRIEMMAAHMSEAASALTRIADAAKPFYTSLDHSQKRIFGWLGRELLMMGHGHPGIDMMSDDGMGLMPRDMGSMRRGPDDDSSDDE
jgi:hypothetical protein